MYFSKNTCCCCFFFFFFNVEVLIILKILTMQSCQSNTHSINILWKTRRLPISHGVALVTTWSTNLNPHGYQENVSFKLSISQLIDEKPSQKRLKLWHKRLFFSLLAGGLRKLSILRIIGL